MPAQHADPDRAQTLTLQAEDLIEGVLARVPEGGWDAPSAVAPWTIRDVAGHVTWGRRLMTHTVTGRPFDDRSGAPGQPHPGAVLGVDPLGAWSAARAEYDAAATTEGLGRPAPPFVLAHDPTATAADFTMNLVGDLIVHAWDIGHALGVSVDAPAELVAAARGWSPDPIRAPGMFGAEQPAPAGADPLTAYAAFLGRRVAPPR